MSTIINLTQHEATPDQREQGVIDLPQNLRDELKKELTFMEIPNADDLRRRAKAIASIVVEFLLDEKSPVRKEAQELLNEEGLEGLKALELKFMIGGAPYLMPPLQEELLRIGTPVYAFSKRVAEEIRKPDGSVEKKVVFRHEGFVEPQMSGDSRKKLRSPGI